MMTFNERLFRLSLFLSRYDSLPGIPRCRIDFVFEPAAMLGLGNIWPRRLGCWKPNSETRFGLRQGRASVRLSIVHLQVSLFHYYYHYQFIIIIFIYLFIYFVSIFCTGFANRPTSRDYKDSWQYKTASATPSQSVLVPFSSLCRLWGVRRRDAGSKTRA